MKLEDQQKYFLHTAVGIVIGAMLYWSVSQLLAEPPPAPVSSMTSEQRSEAHAVFQLDSSHTRSNTRLQPVAIATGHAKNARGTISRESESDSILSKVAENYASCPHFDLHLTVPDDSASGYYLVDLSGINCTDQSVASVTVGHSKVTVPVTDSSQFVLRVTAKHDSSSHRREHDSTVILHDHPLWAVEGHVLYPIFKSGSLNPAVSETMAAIDARVFLGEVLSLGVRPELPVLNPLDFGRWRVDLDLGVKLFGQSH